MADPPTVCDNAGVKKMLLEAWCMTYGLGLYVIYAALLSVLALCFALPFVYTWFRLRRHGRRTVDRNDAFDGLDEM